MSDLADALYPEEMIKEEPDARRRMRLRGSKEILRRAETAKASGEIKDYLIFVREDDTKIIDHIHLVKGESS